MKTIIPSALLFILALIAIHHFAYKRAAKKSNETYNFRQDSTGDSISLVTGTYGHRLEKYKLKP
jgi:hypothetical protein